MILANRAIVSSRSAFEAFCCIVACASAISCGSRSRESSDAKPADFAALRSSYDAAIQNLSDRDDREQIVNELVEAAKRESWAATGDPEEGIMVRWPEDALSLYLLDRRMDALGAETPPASDQTKVQYLEGLRQRVPNTSLSAKALQKSLRFAQSEDADAFLAKCAELIARAPGSTDARVALHERLEYYIQQGRTKDAALDTLRFWSAYPEVVERMEVATQFVSNLRNAGWLLEAQMLSQTTGPAEVAKGLLAEFSHAGESHDEHWQLSTEYLDHTPDYLAVENAVTILPEGPVDRQILWWARLSCLSAVKLDGENSDRYFSKFVSLLDNRRAFPVDPGTSLAEINAAALSAIFNAFGQSRWLDRFAPTGTSAAANLTTLMARSSRAGCDLAFERLNRPEDAAQYLKLVEAHEEFLRKVHRIDGLSPEGDRSIAATIADAYDSVVSRFPKAPEAPRAMLRKASVYREASDQATAVQAYDALIAQYPEAAEVPLAKLDRAASLIASKQYDVASGALKAVLEEYAADNRIVPAAEFLAAVCADNLGSADEAVRRMESIAEEFTKSTYAVRALFWLANHALAQNEYEAARYYLAELIDRYPEDRLASDARQLKKRLDDRVAP